MAFDVETFVALRPYLYHLTSPGNLRLIAQGRTMHPASHLMRMGQREDLATVKRATHTRISVGGDAVSLRDQQPLHERNIALTDGWTFEDLKRSLNARIFFWPGAERGPSEYGLRHFARYASERPMILRIATQELLSANRSTVPEFCRYNSGSPRWTAGRPSPRGPETFLPATSYAGTPGSVVEVTFATEIRLPSSAAYAKSPIGPWQPLEA